MKLSNIQFELNLSKDFKLNNLRKYIIDNISERGEILRWSINKIEIQNKNSDVKVLTINAVIINK